VVPLAFAAGPGLRTAWALASGRWHADTTDRTWWRSHTAIAAIGCGLLTLQAFLPRHAAARPSSAHYYNLANIEESLGRTSEALAHYERAAQKNPKQPVFWFRLAYLARRTGERSRALHALDQLDALTDVPEPIRNASRSERRLLDAAVSGASAPR
jgi:tetratricopeptide (TPR) repeat protein